MKRHRYLVAYDIRDPKRLRRVHRVVKGFGIPFQYSVFVCDLTSAERFDLLTELESIIMQSQDCVASVRLGDADDDKMFTILGPAPTMPSSGATII